MGKKLLLQDLADALAERGGVTKKKAELFSRAIFDVIMEGLTEDSFVKVKGFGTFKIVEVSERESVNINTGQRFQINGHNRVAFTPDAALKELINRPFSQFQTVVINEGTDLAEMEKVGDELPPLEKETETEASENIAPNSGNGDGEQPSDASNAGGRTPEKNSTSTHDDKTGPEDVVNEETETGGEGVSSLNAGTEQEESGKNPLNIEGVSDVEADESKGEEEDDVPPPVPQSPLECTPPPIPETLYVTKESEGDEPKSPAEIPEPPLGMPQSGENGDVSSSFEQPKTEQSGIGQIPGKKDVSESEDDCRNEDNGQPSVAESNGGGRDVENAAFNQNKESVNATGGCNDHYRRRRGFRLWRFIVIFLLLLVLMALSYFAGYFRVLCPCSESESVANETQVVPVTSVADSTMKSDKGKVDSLIGEGGKSDSVSVGEKKHQAANSNQVGDKQKEKNPKGNTGKGKFSSYTTNRYVITGTRQEYVIAKGETIRGIAEDVYGSKGYAVYIIRYNNLKNPDFVKAGTVIKLPELERADK